MFSHRLSTRPITNQAAVDLAQRASSDRRGERQVDAMLVFKRLAGQSIRIGDAIRVRILRGTGRAAMVGIEAPPEIPVDREEVYHAKRQSARRVQTEHAPSFRPVGIGQFSVGPLPCGHSFVACAARQDFSGPIRAQVCGTCPHLADLCASFGRRVTPDGGLPLLHDDRHVIGDDVCIGPSCVQAVRTALARAIAAVRDRTRSPRLAPSG